jgi:hypothetical protein
MPLVMAPGYLTNVLDGADVVTTIFYVLDYVNKIGHRGVLKIEQRPVKKSPSPERQAFIFVAGM